jgi:hypothetical protein
MKASNQAAHRANRPSRPSLRTTGAGTPALAAASIMAGPLKGPAMPALPFIETPCKIPMSYIGLATSSTLP